MLDDVAEDVGEAEASALEFEGEAFVVEAQAVEDGGLDVVDVDGVGFDHGVRPNSPPQTARMPKN